MNDFERDELASAYLDDAVSDEERARVDGDAELRSRVDELRRVRDALHASPVEPPPNATREASIAAALAASPVIDLGAERARRRVRIASVAAVAILLVGAVGLVLRLASDGSSTKTASTAAAASSSSSAPLAATGAQADTNAFSAIPNRVLSTYANRDALVAAVNAATATKTSTAAAGDAAAGPDSTRMAEQSASASRCAVPPPESSSSLILTDDAVLDGALVQVDVFAMNDGTRRLVVTTAGSCTLVFTQTL